MKISGLAGASTPAFFLEKILNHSKIIPNTYLFYGPKYSGKEFLAVQFFKALNCESLKRKGCGECSSCKKIDFFTSSEMSFLYSYFDVSKINYLQDLYLKNPVSFLEQKIKTNIYQLMIYLNYHKPSKKGMDLEKLYEVYEKPLTPTTIKVLREFTEFASGIAKNIPVEAVRQAIEKVYIGSFELKYKLLLIKDAADLSAESGNMLLKTIEEPPADTMIILITSRIGRVLPTLRSRAIKIRFKPYSEAQILEINRSMNGFSLVQPATTEFTKNSLFQKLEELTVGETALLIDFLKEGLSILSPVQKERIHYLNELKAGILYYNLPLNSVKNALKILAKKI